MEELRHELVIRGEREPISEQDLHNILDNYGYLPPRARSFDAGLFGRTDERRIAEAIDELEAI